MRVEGLFALVNFHQFVAMSSARGCCHRRESNESCICYGHIDGYDRGHTFLFGITKPTGIAHITVMVYFWMGRSSVNAAFSSNLSNVYAGACRSFSIFYDADASLGGSAIYWRRPEVVSKTRINNPK
jgi:hypothetical protein